jgi:hypothetical protein
MAPLEQPTPVWEAVVPLLEMESSPTELDLAKLGSVDESNSTGMEHMSLRT